MVSAARLDLQETAIGAALLLQVAERGDLAVLEDQHLVAALFHVAQQVRGKEQVQVAAVADLLNKLDHAHAGGRVEPVGGLVQKQQLGAVGDGLRQLGGLLHAQRIGAQRAVTHFAQADVEERFVGALQGVRARQARQFRHQPHKAHAAHGGDEGVVLRHVAHQRAHFAGVRADVAPEDARGSRGRLVKAQQRVDEGGFARSVRPQQADGAAGERGFQLVEDDTFAEANFEAVQFDDRVHESI